jgi:hypothetical protein
LKVIHGVTNYTVRWLKLVHRHFDFVVADVDGIEKTPDGADGTGSGVDKHELVFTAGLVAIKEANIEG